MKSEFISQTINTIADSIQSGVFVDVEKSKVELKDLSTKGDWKSLHETICAFLNTDGGTVICGVRERNKKYWKKCAVQVCSGACIRRLPRTGPCSSH